MVYGITQRKKGKSRIKPGYILTGVIGLWVFFIPMHGVQAMDFNDFMDIGAAFMTNLAIHEVGHQIVADEVGAKNHHIRFFAKDNGQFYFGLSSYNSIPAKSRLPYAAGGERMSVYTFEYGLQSYREQPSTYNKALLFFSTVDFLSYTLVANYLEPENEKFDPNAIRKEIGCSKELLLGFALTKTLINTYRISHKDANIMPLIETSRDGVLFLVGFKF
jgi:hypothetical protein